MTAPPLTDWAPIRLCWRDGQFLVEWCRVGDRRFTDPFFEQTIDACMRHPFNLLFRRESPVETLLEWHTRRRGIAPTGFIFHMSRCGSTLASQMLAALPQNIVLSEASPIDGVLGACRKNLIPEQDRCALLQAMVSALGQPRRGETRLFVKFECWHVVDLPLIRKAFPNVPWIFLYRDPVEVLVSQARQPGTQLVPGMMDMAYTRVGVEAAIAMGQDEYAARLLADFCRAALDNVAHGGLLVNYRELPEAMFTTVAGFFGTPWSAADVQRMRHITQFNAKTPQMYFADDTTEKQRGATERIRETARTWLAPIYEQLEASRHATNAASAESSTAGRTPCRH